MMDGLKSFILAMIVLLFVLIFSISITTFYNLKRIDKEIAVINNDILQLQKERNK